MIHCQVWCVFRKLQKMTNIITSNKLDWGLGCCPVYFCIRHFLHVLGAWLLPSVYFLVRIMSLGAWLLPSFVVWWCQFGTFWMLLTDQRLCLLLPHVPFRIEPLLWSLRGGLSGGGVPGIPAVSAPSFFRLPSRFPL